MERTTLDFDIIKKKDKFIESVKEKLKTEFFGIDKQIDDIINNMKTWYLFPMLQEKPIVINLWGMTGCGKTHLVDRIIELLDIEDTKIYFNMASIDGSTPNEVDEVLSSKVKNFNCETPIVIIDEIQYARTISEDNMEVNKPSLKPFWNLMDSGKFNVKFDVRVSIDMFRMKEIADYVAQSPTCEIYNGCVVNGYDEIRSLFSRYDGFCSAKESFNSYEYALAEDEPSPKNKKYGLTFKEYETLLKEDIMSIPEEIRPTIFNNDQKVTLFRILSNNKKYKDILKNVGDVYNLISKMNKFQIQELINEAHKEISKGDHVDLSKSLVFVMGNIDEAYTMAFDMNADMSPDQFNKITKNINVVDIKKALQRRFRNEQIARLGSIHIIYPSFDSDTFRKIIDKLLYNYQKNVEEKIGFPIDFDQTLKDAIFKDSIFPTQGARPIFTSIYEIVQTKLPKAFTMAMENKIKFDKLIYSFNDNKVILTFFNENTISDVIEIKQELRLDNLRDIKETNFQTLCAVHESGHAILSMILENEIPEKICSVTTDDNIGGFVLKPFNKNKIENKDSLIKSVAVKLGGRVAEEIIFGDKLISNGASSDLMSVTRMLLEAYKNNGFGNILVNNGWVPKNNDIGTDCKVYNQESDKYVLDACNDGKKLAYDTIIENYDLFMTLCEYLTEHNGITDTKIKELLKEKGFNKLLDVLENSMRKEYENAFKEKLKEFKKNQ